jgi:hypothetical protein
MVTFSCIFKKDKLDLSIEISYLLTYFYFDRTANETFNPAYIPIFGHSMKTAKCHQYSEEK